MSSIKNIALLAALAGLASCSLQKKIGASAKEDVIDAPGLQTAHIGISVFEPATGKYWYDYQADKYFVPASNTKIFTCYAGMKYLGDSLPGIKYLETNDELLLFPTGDPSFLHADFKRNPVLDFLKSSTKNISISASNWREKGLGFGWAWDDYTSDYMAERSPLDYEKRDLKRCQNVACWCRPGVPGDNMVS